MLIDLARGEESIELDELKSLVGQEIHLMVCDYGYFVGYLTGVREDEIDYALEFGDTVLFAADVKLLDSWYL